MTTRTTDATIAGLAPAKVPTWGWAARRAAIGLSIMLLVTAAAALLANATIEPEADARVVPSSEPVEKANAKMPISL